MHQDDMPLTDGFYENPLEYLQNHVRNLNNEIFLSQYHINSLYALLLIGRNSPWDIVKGNSPRAKEEIDLVLNLKVQQVKAILENLSNMYEDKSKKTAITQIQKLMSILKAKKKSIFIEKDRTSQSYRKFEVLSNMAKSLEKQEQQLKQKQAETSTHPQVKPVASEQAFEATLTKAGDIQVERSQKQNEKAGQQVSIEASQKVQKQIAEIKQIREPLVQKEQLVCMSCSQERPQRAREEEDQELPSEQKPPQRLDNGKEVFSIFYGLSNMSNLTALALTNIVEHNVAQRYIKFKMSESYIMTIKSEDPFHFDLSSQFRKVPGEMFTNHVFPYLTASELFQCRSVCKEWLELVKESWHATFKRQMFIQLLACQFCKDIEFYYKTIQLRNPFFQKISLLIHALIQIINWEAVRNLIQTNSLSQQLKKILMLLLRLIGQHVPITSLNAINDAFYNEHKHMLQNIKEKISQFFSNLSGSDLSVNDLRFIKTHFLDDPFMRVEDAGADDKTPLLLNLLVKQITLQQILRNHIYLAQEYLLNTKKRLDNISKKMVYQKGYLEGVYKILLLKATEPFASSQAQTNELPNFNEMLQSIFSNKNCEKPDFVLRSKSSSTEIYLDNATKLDIILSTVSNLHQKADVHKGEEKIVQINTESNFEPQSDQRSQEQKEERREKNNIVSSVNMKIQPLQQENASVNSSAQPQLAKEQEGND